MDKHDLIISGLVNALADIERATFNGESEQRLLCYIRGIAMQAQANANVHRERNRDGYLVVAK